MQKTVEGDENVSIPVDMDEVSNVYLFSVMGWEVFYFELCQNCQLSTYLEGYSFMPSF